MLKRDFTKSNWEYVKKNKFVLIGIAVVLILALVIGCVFGMNKNFELKGYNEFKVQLTSEQTNDISKHNSEIESLVNSYSAKFDNISVFGEGDNTVLIVRYLNKLDLEKQTDLNNEVANKLGIDATRISDHIFVSPIVKNSDYIYTSLAILILVIGASIFAYIRYNGASAITLIISCALGTAGFLSIGTLLRLSIGLNYFAMLVILNLLISYCAINIFEEIRSSNYLINNEYDLALDAGMSRSKFKMCFLAVAIMVIGVLFVLIGPNTLKLASLNIMFIPVVMLAVAIYVIPFVLSILITHSRNQKSSIKKD